MPGGDPFVDNGLALRAFCEDDLGFLDRLCSDPQALGPFEWAGFGDVRARRRRWEQDGYVGPDSTALAVVLADGTLAGIASWKARIRSDPDRGICYEIGLALLPEHRGHGLGTAAQQLLVDYLLKSTTVHRLEAFTDSENIAEAEGPGTHRLPAGGPHARGGLPEWLLAGRGDLRPAARRSVTYAPLAAQLPTGPDPGRSGGNTRRLDTEGHFRTDVSYRPAQTSRGRRTGTGSDVGVCAEGCCASLQVAQRRVRYLGEWLPVFGRCPARIRGTECEYAHLGS